MLRLSILGADDATRQMVAARLRQAVIVDDTASACDAVVLLGGALPERDEGAGRTGPPVLLSSDLCRTASDCQRLAGCRCTIVNFDRYLPSRRLIRQQLDTDKLGEPGLLRVHRWESTGAVRFSTGLLRDLDCVLWLAGARPDAVYGLENASGVQIHLGFPGGAMAVLYHADHLPAGSGYSSFSLIGSRGAVYADDQQNTQLVFRGGPPRGVFADESTVAVTAGIQAFVDSLAAGVDQSGTGASWQETLATLDMVRESVRTRRVIGPGRV
jgi:predicted dehydrogenase